MSFAYSCRRWARWVIPGGRSRTRQRVRSGFCSAVRTADTFRRRIEDVTSARPLDTRPTTFARPDLEERVGARSLTRGLAHALHGGHGVLATNSLIRHRHGKGVARTHPSRGAAPSRGAGPGGARGLHDAPH